MSFERCIIVDRFENASLWIGLKCKRKCGMLLFNRERLGKGPFYTEEKRYFKLDESEIVDALTWLAA
jgi:hypothetical protein